MPTDFETLDYTEADGVATVTLNRPEVYNAFNERMQRELRALWIGLKTNDDVRCIVLTGAGDKAFCTGIDRAEAMGDGSEPVDSNKGGHGKEMIGYDDPWNFDDPGDWIGPKANGLWKPVVAAVNGMACGGAFYMLGEVEFIIAADHATFFDPHVTFGMTAAFEPIHLLQKMPFQEIMRMSLLGSSRAHVGEARPRDRPRLRGRARRRSRRDRRLVGPPDRRLPDARHHGHRAGALDRPRTQPPSGTRPDVPVHERRQRSRCARRGPASVHLRRPPRLAPSLTTGLSTSVAAAALAG